MPVVAQRQNPAVLAATATTNLRVNRALYSVVVPAFGLVLLVLALRKGFNSGNYSRSAYAFIVSLAFLSGLAGSLGSHAKVEAIIQALLSLFLCIPVLHLTSVHNNPNARSQSRCQIIIRTLLKSLLFISLSSATLLAVLNLFLTRELPAAAYLSFPATFLAYTIFALCLLLSQLFLAFGQVNSGILSASSPRPITINIRVATRSATFPINLARSSSFSAQYQGVQEPDRFSTELAELQHQKRPSVDSGISIISAFKPTTFVASAHPSRSNRKQGSDTLEFSPVLQFRTRNQPLPLLCLFLAQLTLCASYSSKLAINYKAPSPHVLEIVHTALNVVSVMATMKAYLFHACNTHWSLALPVPNPRSSSMYSNRATQNLVSDVVGEQATPIGHTVAPPIPPKSLASPLSRSPTQRLPSLVPGFNPNIRKDRPRSTTSDHSRSFVHMIDSDEKRRDGENGRLVNSFSVGSLKSAYGTSGSEESDQTRVEGSAESDASEIVRRHVGDLKVIHPHVSMRQRVQSPEANTGRRGTIPSLAENSVPKRLLGFGWLNGMANRYRESREKDHIDIEEERCGMKPSVPPSSVLPLPIGTHMGSPMPPARGREPRKLKRNITIASASASTTLCTPTPHPPSSFTYAYWNSDSTLCKTSSSDLETDMIMGNIVPSTPVRSVTKKLVEKGSYEYVSPQCGMHESLDKGSEGDEEGRNRIPRCGRTASQGGLRLKRSFKLDDGRTLGPQLTLAAAISDDVCTYANETVKCPVMEGEMSPGSCWETEVKGGRSQGMPVWEERMGNSQVNGGMRVVAEEVKIESDGKWEDSNAPPPLSETPFSLANFGEIDWHPDSAMVQSQKAPGTHAVPEKSRERPWVNISQHVAQRPLEGSVATVLIPATSARLIRKSIPTTTPTFAARTTVVTYPSTPSESASCSSSATASPLALNRTPMIFSSASDQDHGQGSREPFPLARISSSPSSRIQPVFSRRRNAGATTISMRGMSTFSSSSSSSSLRLSMRNAISGILSGKRNGKTGLQPSPVHSTTSESIDSRGSLEEPKFGAVVILNDDDGDFTDLRDPFASPRAGKVRRIPSGGYGVNVDSSEDGHGEPCEDLFVTTGGFKRKKNSWGRLPVTPKGYSCTVPRQSESYATSLGTENTTYFSRIGDVPPHAKLKEYRKERRRKRMERGPKIPMAKLPALDDMEFDVEEALLTQRLLKRLDDDMHVRL